MSQKKSKPRIIIWDIETLPNLKEVLSIFPSLGDYPGKTLKATINSIICVGWKEFGEKRTHCISAWDYKYRWSKNINDDYSVCKTAQKVLKDADLLVTHNGSKFDIKHLNTRLSYHNLPILHKIPHVDTKVLAKRFLYLYDNKLNTLAKTLTKQEKLKHNGWDLWVDVWNKKKTALSLMEKYCMQDVIALEAVFKKLLPFVKNMPVYGFYTGHDRTCPNCGSLILIKYGTSLKGNIMCQKWQCKKCGSISHTRVDKPTILKPL